MTAMRETLEERLASAFSEFDIGAMPSSWSWQKAAETLSVEVALQLIREQKSEPLDPAFQKECEGATERSEDVRPAGQTVGSRTGK